MKTVIVFDTEDERGMADAVKIMDHLASQYLQKRLRAMSSSEQSFGRIEFIKMLRKWTRKIIEDLEKDSKTDVTGLKYTKDWADKLWKEKSFRSL